jgi:ATP-dependent RNA helicase DBP3
MGDDNKMVKKEKRDKGDRKEKKSKREKKEKKDKRSRSDTVQDCEDNQTKKMKIKTTATTTTMNTNTNSFVLLTQSHQNNNNQNAKIVGDFSLIKSGGNFQKRFYVPNEEIKNLSKKDVNARRESLAITIENDPGTDNFTPLVQFTEAGFPKEILAVCKNFLKPSPIQSQSWPIIMSGYDMVGIAATGSGKTLAFGLPALTQIKSLPPCKAGQPACLVLAPTRELAQQTAKVFHDAGDATGIKCVCVYGGGPKYLQKQEMKQSGFAVIVATPGRLRDFMNDGDIRLDRVTMLILDEADRMLDLGFEPEIRAIASATRADRQTVMFSATWPKSVQGLAAEFMSSPVMCRIGAEGLKASHTIKQIVEVVEPHEKDQHLNRLLNKYLGSEKVTPRCLVFALYKKECARVHDLLRRNWKSASIHGDMSQQDREKSVASFKSGETPILVATDVAARGLDIPGVEYVINYTFPLTTEDYVHRIGRTGRAGATGIAHTLFTVHDKARAGELANVLREAGEEVPESLSKFGTHVKKKESKLYGAHFKDVDMSAKSTKITFD